MHSSRMRTGRSLTICWSLLPGGGQGGMAGGCLVRGVSGLGGVWSEGGVWSGGCLVRGVSGPGGLVWGGVVPGGCGPGGVYPSMH